MAKCDYCGTTIVFGGVRDGDLRFCNQKCHQNGVLVKLASAVPPELLEKQVQDVHGGPCPCCNAEGPVDVHTSYRIWSALLLTSWNSRVRVSCRSCGIKQKLGDTVFCLFLGWWGFPWGVLGTPLQISRNMIGVFRSPDPATPSKLLHRMVCLTLAERFVREEQAAGKRGQLTA